MMKFFKKTLQTLVALACFWCLCWGVSLVLGPPAKKGIEKFPDNSLDYFVFGDSEAYSSFSPLQVYRETGFTGYNMGVALNHIQDASYDFKEALKTQTPKTIFVETNFLFRSRDMMKASMRYFDHIAPRLMPLLDNHDNWKQLLSKKHNHPKITNLETMRGFILNASVNPWGKSNSKSETAKQKTFAGGTEKFLNDFISLAQAHNIQVIFYAAPSPINWTEDHYQEVKNYADTMGIPYYDFNKNPEWVNIDWNTDTFDRGDHLNFAGAQKITHFFVELLKQSNRFSDHRLDADTVEWQNALNHYNSVTGFKQ